MSIATQADMLNKIYGAEKVAQWDGEKRHEVYRHLIAREYDQMMRDDRKKKEGKLLAKAKATEAKRRKAHPEDLLKVGGTLETEKGIVHLVRQDGKYKVLQQPYEVWQGKRYPSSRGWKVLKSGTLGECQKAVNAAAGVKAPAKKKPAAKQTARKRATAKKR